jgi:hypothetical protein
MLDGVRNDLIVPVTGVDIDRMLEFSEPISRPGSGAAGGSGSLDW